MSINLITGEENDERKEWVKEWVGMPEFNPSPMEQKYATVIVHIATEEDFNSFCKLINQKLVIKKSATKPIWYPKKSPSLFDEIYDDESSTPTD